MNGDLSISSGTTLDADSTHNYGISLAGNWVNNGGTFTPRSGTVTFNSTSASQAIEGTAASQTFYNITVNKTGQTLSIGDSTTTLTLNATLTLSAGTFSAGTATTINVAGGWSNSGTSFAAGSSPVKFSGSPHILGTTTTTFNNLEIVTGTTYADVNCNVSGTMTVDTGATFSFQTASVVINSSSAQGMLAGSGTILVMRTSTNPDLVHQYQFTTYSLGSLTVNYTGSGNQTINNTVGTYGALSTSSSGTKTVGGDITVATVMNIGSGTTLDGSSATITLSGSGTPLVVVGSFTPTSSTIKYTSGSGATVAGTGYYNLAINGTGPFSLGSAATVGGALTITSGTFDANGKTVSVTGLTTVNGGTYQASTATQTLTGGLTASSGSFASSSGTVNAGNLTVSGGTFTGSSGTLNATAVALSSGSLTAPGSSGTFNVTGNWSQTGGTFTHNSGTVTVNGTGARPLAANQHDLLQSDHQ